MGNKPPNVETDAETIAASLTAGKRLKNSAKVDFAISVFRLSNRRGYSVPRLNIQYLEKGTGQEWWLTCGGTRGYAARVGTQIDADAEGQAADSHFMMRRVTSSLLLGGAGLFQDGGSVRPGHRA